MSISYKKINLMIEQEIERLDELSKDQKRGLRTLCEKIYMMESSIEQVSNQQTIADIKGEISLKADSFLE
jgi:hypothetical protein